MLARMNFAGAAREQSEVRAARRGAPVEESPEKLLDFALSRSRYRTWRDNERSTLLDYVRAGRCLGGVGDAAC
jgi:hypothetical protein